MASFLATLSRRCSSRPVVRVRIALAALGAATALVAAMCAPIRAPGTVDAAAEALAVREALGAPNGIVIGFNPATCAFGTGLGLQHERIAREARLPALVILYGITLDSAAHLAVRNDLALSLPSVLISAEEATARFGIPEGGAPTLLVLKRSELVLVARGSALGTMDDWLPQFLGTHAP